MKRIRINFLSMISQAYGIVLIALFAVLSMLLVALGSQNYVKTANAAQQNTQSRDTLNYVLNKVRVMDGEAALSIREQEGVEMLVFTQEIEGELYDTRIYCYNGYLRELFTAHEATHDLRSGEEIAKAQQLTVTPGDPWCFTVTDPEGRACTQYAALRSEEGTPWK